LSAIKGNCAPFKPTFAGLSVFAWSGNLQTELPEFEKTALIVRSIPVVGNAGKSRLRRVFFYNFL